MNNYIKWIVPVAFVILIISTYFKYEIVGQITLVLVFFILGTNTIYTKKWNVWWNSMSKEPLGTIEGQKAVVFGYIFIAIGIILLIAYYFFLR